MENCDSIPSNINSFINNRPIDHNLFSETTLINANDNSARNRECILAPKEKLIIKFSPHSHKRDLRISFSTKNTNHDNGLKYREPHYYRITPQSNIPIHRPSTNQLDKKRAFLRPYSSHKGMSSTLGHHIGSRHQNESTNYEFINLSMNYFNSFNDDFMQQGVGEDADRTKTMNNIEIENKKESYIEEGTSILKLLDEPFDLISNDIKEKKVKKKIENFNEKENHSNPKLKNYTRIESNHDVLPKRSSSTHPTFVKLRLNSANSNKHTPNIATRGKIGSHAACTAFTKFEPLNNSFFSPFDNKLFNLIATPLSPRVTLDCNNAQNNPHGNNDSTFFNSSSIGPFNNYSTNGIYGLSSNITFSNGKLIRHSDKKFGFMGTSTTAKKVMPDRKKLLMKLKMNEKCMDPREIYKEYLASIKKMEVEGDDDGNADVNKLHVTHDNDNHERYKNLIRVRTSNSSVGNTYTHTNSDTNKLNLNQKLSHKIGISTKNDSPIRSMANKLTQFSKYNKLDLKKIKKELGDSLSTNSDDITLREYVGKTLKIVKQIV